MPTTSVAVGALFVGYAQQKGWLDKLPQVGGSAAVSLGVLGYVATRFVRNHHVRAAGLAALAVGAFDFARQQAGGPSGLEDVSGDEYTY